MIDASATTTSAILAINAGSSSLKFALYEAESLALLCRGGVSGLGTAARLDISGPLALTGAPSPARDYAGAVAWLLDALRRVPGLAVRAAGHRVVHGGRDFAAPVRIDDAVLAGLDRLVPLAPAHQPLNLAGLRAVAEVWPGLPQIACFDTAFHRSQPRLAQLFPIPRALIDDPFQQWKLSPMDLESYRRWYACSRARDAMLAATDSDDLPWYVVRSDDKRRARLNRIAHLLHLVPYKRLKAEPVSLPKRDKVHAYDDTLRDRASCPSGTRARAVLTMRDRQDGLTASGSPRSPRAG